MAGTLLVSNVHFDSAGTNRIDYVDNDGVIRIASNAIKVPTGNTSSRPTSEEGLIRYNNEIGTFEGSNATSWGAIGGGGGTVFPVLTVTTDNDGSFDMNVTNNFKCTPSGTISLTFTNTTSGQSGYVLLDNAGGHAITANTNTKVNDSFLTTVSTAGTYLCSYFADGTTNVYVTTSGAMS